MASLFGSVATEFGGTLKDMAQDKREERLKNEEAMREMQLEKQRMAHQSKLTQYRIDSDDRRAAREQEFRVDRYEIELADQQTAAEAERTFEATESAADRYSRETIALIGAYNQNEKTNGIKTKGWSIKTDMVQSINEDGQLVNEPVFIASRDGDPTAWMQEGSFMFRGGDRQHFDSVLANPDTAYMNDRDARAKVESVLMQNLGNKQIEADFERKFGYLPSEYLSALTMQHDPNIREWVEKNRSPAYDVSDRLTPPPSGGGGRKSAPGTSPESRKLRNQMGSYETGSVGPDWPRPPSEGEGITTEDEQYMVERAKAEGRSLGKDDFMQAQAAGELPSTRGGRLSQGQAAEGELQQGGQLDEEPIEEVRVTATPRPGPVPEIMKPPVAAAGGGKYLEGESDVGRGLAAIYNQSPGLQTLVPVGKGGGVISDEEAAAIADAVSADMAGMHGGGKTF